MTGEPAGAEFREGGGSCSRVGPPGATPGPPHTVGPLLPTPPRSSPWEAPLDRDEESLS